MYAEKWLLTMFMYNWPYKVAVRVWDVVMSEGPILMFSFMLGVIETAKEQLSIMDAEQLLLFLTGSPQAPSGGFKAVIASTGVSAFIELALRLEVRPETLKSIDERASRSLRKQLSTQSSTSPIERRRTKQKKSRGGICASKS
eukprot:SAG31_NODE_186_length_20918_cov_26.890917_21_plen_143_part_00